MQMETLNHVLYFLNKLDLVGHLESSDYDKFKWIKKMLIDEFEDANSEKLIIILDVLDNLHMLFITQDFQNVQILTDLPREDIFSLVKLSCNQH